MLGFCEFGVGAACGLLDRALEIWGYFGDGARVFMVHRSVTETALPIERKKRFGKKWPCLEWTEYWQVVGSYRRRFVVWCMQYEDFPQRA